MINGQTGEMNWLFHSMSGIPVAPIPVPGDFTAQQALVMWLPKLEALTLNSKDRKSRHVRPRDRDGNYDDDSAAVDSAKKISRHRRHQEWDDIFSKSAINPSDRLYYHDFDDDVDDDDDDDYNDDGIAYNNEDQDESNGDDYLASKELELAFLSEILKDSKDSPFVQMEPFNSLKEHNNAHDKLPDVRKEVLPAVHQGHYSEDLIPNRGKENSDVKADPEMHTTELEEELTDITNHKKDESNHKANAPWAPVTRDHTVLPSRPRVIKEFPPEPTRKDFEDSYFQKSNNLNQQLPTENDKQGNHKEEKTKFASAKKLSYHKRSVQSSQTGSQCIRRIGDSADSFLAVLLMKDADGREVITEITEEGPLYLGKCWKCLKDSSPGGSLIFPQMYI